MPEQVALEKWLQTTAVYGLAFVFLASFLLICLWVAVSAVKTLREWVPKWFASSIETHEETRRFLRSISRAVRTAARQTGQMHGGFARSLHGVNLYLQDKGVRERLGVRSDVVFELRAAEDSLCTDAEDDYDRRESESEREELERHGGDAGDATAQPGV